MKIGFASCIVASLSFMAVEGSLRGETNQAIPRRAMEKSDSKDKEDVTEDDPASVDSAGTEAPTVVVDHCRDIPVQVRHDNSQVNFATLYTGIYAWGNTTTVDDKKICDVFEESYKSLTNCSAVPGSYREIGDCEVIPGAAGPDASAKLLRLTYFANTVDGAQLYEFESPDSSCVCERCPNLDPFPGIYQADDSGPVCTCYCDIFSTDLSTTACTCRSPIISELIDTMNAEYVDEDFYFLDARQLSVKKDCESSITTFDDTTVCAGVEDPSFTNYWTEYPSAVPTEAPTEP
jgi:hypothetical protein